jgi:hypothetical protein
MGLRVAAADAETRARWNDYLDRSPQGTPFHQLEAGRVLAAHTNTDAHYLVGYVGDEPIGLFPVMETNQGGFSAVFSPPPDIRVPTLGPVLLDADWPKQRKAERWHREFVDGCYEWIDEELSPQYIHFRTARRYRDLRPFMWNGFDVTPEYTYAVDLDRDEAALLDSFSRDARTNATSDAAADCTVEVGDDEAIGWIIEQVRRRLASEGISYHVTAAFVRDLREALPAGQVRPYVCRADGEIVSGIITLEYGDVIYRWQGGIARECDVPANDILDWQVMREARSRGLETYDLVGASTPRLNRYKAKFAPEVGMYHRVERSGTIGRLAARMYKRLR